MRSIQSRLTFWMAIATTVVSVASGGSLVAWLRRALVEEFDRSLLIDARTLQSLVTTQPEGRLDVDIDARALSDFTGPSATAYFRFDDVSGNEVATLGSAPMQPNPDMPSKPNWDARLSNGIPARVIRVEFQPAIESNDRDERPMEVMNPLVAPMTLRLTVARDRRPLDSMLLRTTVAVGAGGTLFSLFAIAAAVVVVRRGLLPLRDLASEVAAIDVARGTNRFDDVRRSNELRPIVQRLNELLDRVAVALSRERQFTAAVSHELRTPIAELRCAADVAAREPDDLGLARRAVLQAQDIAIQMQAIVSTLLSISTVERSAEPAGLENIALRRELEHAIERRAIDLSRRGLKVDNRVSDGLVVYANRPLLAGILENALRNASQYARLGSLVVLEGEVSRGDVVLVVQNEQEMLTPDDATHVFDPFWRKDSARSNGLNVGLGLTLVRAYCAAMGATVAATVSHDGRFRLELRCRAGERVDVAHSHADERFATIGGAS